MSKQSSLRNKILLPVIGGIVFYILMCIYAGRGELMEAFSRFRLHWLPVILLLAFLNYVLRYVKFYYYLRVLKVPLKPGIGFVIFLSSFVMAITPGKLGEVLKSVFIKDLTGVEKSRTAPIVVAERVTDLLAFIVMTLIGISGFTHQKGMLVVIGITFALIIGFCGLIGIRSFSLMALEFFVRLPVVKRVGPKLRQAYDSTYELIVPRRLFWAVLISVPSWSCEVVAFWLVFYAMGIHVPFDACFFIYSVGTILGAVAFLPGGLGLTEASIAGLLVNIIGLTTAQATSGTLIVRLCTLWFAVILGGVIFFLFQKRLGGKHALEEVMEAGAEGVQVDTSAEKSGREESGAQD
jgi:uncharacterized protein (TIRG00374 family)